MELPERSTTGTGTHDRFSFSAPWRLCERLLWALVPVLLVAQVAVAADAPPAGPGWPQWRGPRQDGVSDEKIALWPPVKRWETNVGRGVSSPIAARGRVFAMGHRQGEDTVWCLEASTGRVTWKFSYPAKSDQTSDVRFPGPRSTPATDGRAVYTLSLEGRLHALDATSGKLLWQRSPQEMGAYRDQQYGICCPVSLWDRMVVCDVASHLVAMDKTTGRELWRAAGGRGWNGAAPVVARLGDRLSVVYGTGRCVDAADGRLLWSVPYGEMSVATPVVAGDRIFLAPFHGRNYGGKECAVLRVAGGRPEVLWKNDEVQGLCLSAVALGGHLYAPDRDDLSLAGESGRKMSVKCLDLESGLVRWTWRPISWPSLLVVGGKLLIQTQEGEVILAEVSPAGHKELGRFQAIERRCWTSLALADGLLFCRNNQGDLACWQVAGTPGGTGCLPASAAPEKPLPPTPRGTAGGTDSLSAAASLWEPEIEPEARSNWPQFRGPGGSGRAWCRDVPTHWNGKTGEGIFWKTPIPLPGCGSPVVWQDRVYLTGADRKTREVYAFDADSGRMLWRNSVAGVPGSSPGPEKPWSPGVQAASTPATDGRMVWAVFANGDLACFDRDGRPLWARNLGTPQNQYGHASSPVLSGGLVLVQLDQNPPDGGRSKLVAIDGRTGRPLWETSRPGGASWATPIVLTKRGSDPFSLVIACGNPWVIGYDRASGKELWRADALEGGYYAVPSPIAAAGRIFSVTEGAMLAAIRPDGTGEVSKTHVARLAEDDLPSVSSPVSDGTRLFLLTSAGMLTCHELPGGKRRWQKDLSDGSAAAGTFEASPILAAGRLYLLDSAGVTHLVEASADEPREVRRAELGEPCPGASPAVVEGRIFLRGQKHLYAIGTRQ